MRLQQKQAHNTACRMLLSFIHTCIWMLINPTMQMLYIVATPHIVNAAYINCNGQTLFVTQREELVKYTKCTDAETYDQ